MEKIFFMWIKIKKSVEKYKIITKILQKTHQNKKKENYKKRLTWVRFLVYN